MLIAVILVAVVLMLGTPAASVADPVGIQFNFVDAPGVGFNDPALGPARRAALTFGATTFTSHFEKSFPTEAERIDVSFEPLSTLAGHELFARSTATIGPPGASTLRPLSLFNHQAGAERGASQRMGSIVFDSDTAFYLGLDAAPPRTQIDFVTATMHEMGHVFGFLSTLDPDGVYRGTPAVGDAPAIYDRAVANRNLDLLVNLSPEERIAAATSGDGLFWFAIHGVAANGDVPPNLEASSPFEREFNVNHFSEEFGPDVLMDPLKAGGEAIHTLSPTELGIFQDLGWTINASPAPAAVPEPTSLALAGSGFAALAAIARRRRRKTPAA